jgi:hypothetical protein
MFLAGCQSEQKPSENKPADVKPGSTSAQDKPADGWISLFDGKTLEGWTKAEENPDSVQVEDGKIVTHGPRCHLFYSGPVKDHNFTNFEFKAEVMTLENSNSGIYFHTQYQKDGWPDKGYEVQVNNTHKDPKKTGGLYAVKDVFEAPAKDGEWFTEHIIVQGKHVTVKVNDKVVVDYTEPDNQDIPKMPGRKLSSGTFAFQAHDPGSTVYFRNVMVKPLD